MPGGTRTPPGSPVSGHRPVRLAPIDNTPSGAAGPSTVIEILCPFQPSICSACASWFNKPSDLIEHYTAIHRDLSLRFTCRKCPMNFKSWHGCLIHATRCKGPKSPPPPNQRHQCPACALSFTSKRGLTAHKNRAHPEVRNAERQAALEPPPPVQRVRASNLWSADEDETLVRRYNEFRASGKLQGYSIFVAQELPGKSEIQVRSRVRALIRNGVLLGEDVPVVAPPAAEVPVEQRRLRRNPPRRRPTYDSSESDDLPDVPEAVDRDPSPPPPPRPRRPPPPDSPPSEPDDEEPDPDGSTTSSEPGSPRDLHEPQAEEPPVPPVLPSPLPSPGRPPVDASPPVPAPERLPARPEWDVVLQHILSIEPVCEIGARLKLLAQDPEDIQAGLDALVGELETTLVRALPAEERPHPQRGGRPTGRSERTRRRVACYAKTQELFKKNPSRLAELVLNNQIDDLMADQRRVDPPEQESVALFSNLWGTEAACTLELPERPAQPNSEVLPVTTGEVEGRIRRLKPRGAPGPEGVTKAALRAYPNILGTLAVLLNVVLFRGCYPASWRKCRTTLIPKQGKDLTKAENWRPITIAPLLGRIFAATVETRLLQQVEISDRQRGFRPGNGCKVNCSILDEVIRLGKRSRLAGVQLDVSKAFDTVAHSAIATVLRAQGVSPCLLSIVQGMYTGSATRLGSFNVDVDIHRGVKQGDPLSPLLFNLVLDPLLRRLDDLAVGFPVGDASISCMAYADDLTLFSSSPAGLQRQLDLTIDYLSSVGMALSPAKCGAFQVQRQGEAWIAAPMDITLGETPLRNFGVAEEFVYLGLSYTLARGFANRRHLDTLLESAERARRLALKPHQKVSLIMQYLVPAFAHRLTIDPPSGNDLARVDQGLRGAVKKSLHLLHSVTDNLLYTRKRDGGLGFPHLMTQVKICALRAGCELIDSADPFLQQLGREAGWRAKVERLAADLRLPFPCTARDIASRKRVLKSSYHSAWVRQESQGVGAQWFKDDPVGNYWLLNDRVLRPGQYIDALKMRTNTWGTRVAINRATRTNVINCRRCHTKPETLGHITGECVVGAVARQRRHNAIVKKVEEECLAQGWTVAREQPFIGVDGGLLKPDLAIKRHDRLFLADVTVVFENRDSLAQAALAKTTTYTPLLPVVQRAMEATSGEVIPVVFGARGSCPRATVTGLKKLGCGALKMLRDLSLIALRTSMDLARCHMDYG